MNKSGTYVNVNNTSSLYLSLLARIGQEVNVKLKVRRAISVSISGILQYIIVII